jgi:septum formation protein
VTSDFEVRAVECEEVYPTALRGGDIAIYLSELKSGSVEGLDSSIMLITADTIVWMDGHIYEKPGTALEAEAMLTELSGKQHHVFTGVTLRMGGISRSFVSDTLVKFEQFSSASIAEYVAAYNPLDKAGAYGIQDCLCEDGEEKGPLSMSIETGSYSNVVGLPVEDLKRELAAFLEHNS